MKNILRLIRPKQWIKNFFVLLPLFFGGALLQPEALGASLLTLVAFSLTASSIYCFNDIIDAPADRRHPVKCHRPIASGAVSVPTAYAMMITLAVVGMALPLLLPDWGLSTMAVLIAYFVLNLLYCRWLKQHAIIDVCVIAVGFVLRIAAGGEATGIELSQWIVLMTFLLTLFMGFAKRRDDVLRMNATGEAPRKNTIRYNLTFINQAITITASVTLVCYIMYTVSPEVQSHFNAPRLYLTTVFVLLGLLRYIQLAVVDEKSGDPTKVILRDRLTQVIVFLWGLSFFIMIYGKRLLS